MNKTPFDDATLKQILDIGANLLFGELTKPATVKKRQHTMTFRTIIEGSGTIDMPPPEDDGQGEWELYGWKVANGALFVHWTRVRVQAEPRIGDFEEDNGSPGDKPPWAPEGATGAAASSSQP